MNAPNLPSFFKAHQPKQFGIKPRYYDQNKEERAARNKQIERELYGGGELDHEAFRNRLKEKWRKPSKSPKPNSSVARVLVYAAGLALFAYYILS